MPEPMPVESDALAALDALRARLQLLEDERDIRAALERYGHTIDYGLEAEWVDCFTNDGVDDHRVPNMPAEWKEFFPFAEFDPGGMRIVGRDALAAFVSLHTRAPETLHKHIVVDAVISVDEPGHGARSTSYFLRVDEMGTERIISAFGKYIDHLERGADGRWRFVERRIELESLTPAANKGPTFGRES
jgi:hypothetical protein